MRIRQEISVYGSDTVTKRFSEIEQTADEISLVVSKKVGYNEVISSINQSAEGISIAANKISLEGLVTANGYFKIKLDGSIEARNATLYGNLVATETVNGHELKTVIGSGEVNLYSDQVLAGRLHPSTQTNSGTTLRGVQLLTDMDYVSLGYWSDTDNDYATGIYIQKGNAMSSSDAHNWRDSKYNNCPMTDHVQVWLNMTCTDRLTMHNRLVIAKEYGFGIVNKSDFTVDYGPTGTSTTPTGQWKWATITDSNGNTCHIPAHYS